MSTTKRRQKPRDFYEVYASVRRDWGQVKPVTRIIQNGKKQSRNQLKKALHEERLDD